MRILAEIATVVAGGLTIANYVIRHFMKERRRSNLEHVQQLLKENKEIDDINKKIQGGS